MEVLSKQISCMPQGHLKLKKFVDHHFVASNWNAGCGGYLDNYKILIILTLTSNCGFPCALGLEKLQKMPRYNYVHIKLPNFVFIVVWRFTLFCPLGGGIYQRSMSGNSTCREPTAILWESNTAYHSKRPLYLSDKCSYPKHVPTIWMSPT